MTEGGISAWKKKPGEKFGVGDVLLELETDKGAFTPSQRKAKLH